MNCSDFQQVFRSFFFNKKVNRRRRRSELHMLKKGCRQKMQALKNSRNKKKTRSNLQSGRGGNAVAYEHCMRYLAGLHARACRTSGLHAANSKWVFTEWHKGDFTFQIRSLMGCRLRCS